MSVQQSDALQFSGHPQEQLQSWDPAHTWVIPAAHAAAVSRSHIAAVSACVPWLGTASSCLAGSVFQRPVVAASVGSTSCRALAPACEASAAQHECGTGAVLWRPIGLHELSYQGRPGRSFRRRPPPRERQGNKFDTADDIAPSERDSKLPSVLHQRQVCQCVRPLPSHSMGRRGRSWRRLSCAH